VFLLSPKSCSDPWSESGDRELDLGGVDPRVLFIPSCLGYTSLTDALDRSDCCEPFVGFTSGELSNSCLWVGLLLVSYWSVWCCLARFCVGFSFCAGCVLGVSLF
jgi:hypothetical protein